MNSVGITSAGGAGMALAQWIVQGYPEKDLWPVDVRRFNKWQNNPKYVEERVHSHVLGCGIGMCYLKNPDGITGILPALSGCNVIYGLGMLEMGIYL